MWIRFLKPAGDHKVNDFLDVEEPVARGYIAAGLAQEEKEGPEKYLLEQARTEYVVALRGLAADSATAIREATEGIRRRPRIDAVESEEDKRKGPTDFLRQVYLAEGSRDSEVASAAHKRLTEVYKVARGMTENTGAGGGYTTPTLYESMVQEVEAEDQVVLPGATNVPLGARTVEYPALDQYQTPTAGQSAFFGGVKIFRKGESTQRTGSQPAFKKIALTAMDQTAYTEIPRDLLMDSTANPDQMVIRLIGEATGWRNDWEALNGSGAGQMLGIYNSPCLIQVTRNTGGTVKYVDLSGMYKRLLPSSRRKAAWIVHPYMLDVLLQIQDPSGRYILQPYLTSNGDSPLGVSPRFQIFGLPVLDTEKAPAPGSTNDVLLADRKRYLYGTRSGLEIGLSEHFKFDTDQVAIRAKCRNDGQPQMKGAITLADGSSTVSAFIGLN